MESLGLFDPARERYADLLLLQGAAAESVEGCLAAAHVLRAAPGETVLRADQPNAYLYIVLRGTLRVDLAGSPDAHATTHVGRGECVGELSVIDGLHTSATVRAVDECDVLALHGEAVGRLAERSHAVAVNLLRLLARRLRGTNALVRESASESLALRMRAITDPLTGLYNRRWLDEALARLAGRADADGARGSSFSLLMVDIDHFKRVNDEEGHLTGDRVLQRVADSVRTSLRPTDFAARYGGEELAVVLPGVDEAPAALAVAERVRRAVTRVSVIGDTGRHLTVTVSIGVAVRAPNEEAKALLVRADTALYQAKNAGRDRVVLALAPGAATRLVTERRRAAT